MVCRRKASDSILTMDCPTFSTMTTKKQMLTARAEAELRDTANTDLSRFNGSIIIITEDASVLSIENAYMEERGEILIVYPEHLCVMVFFIPGLRTFRHYKHEET